MQSYYIVCSWLPSIGVAYAAGHPAFVVNAVLFIEHKVNSAHGTYAWWFKLL